MTVTSHVTLLDTPTGPMRCEIYRPQKEGRFAALVLYSEIFQITAPIARTAAFLAGQGYVVIIPEVFHELNPEGTVLSYDEQGKEKGNCDKHTKALTAHDSDLDAILSWIGHPAQSSYCAGPVGAFGMCLGGHLALRAALNKQILAASCLYATDLHSNTLPSGTGKQTLEQLAAIPGEVLMVWGRQDPHVPFEGRALLYEHFHNAGLSYTWHELNAQHAFLRDGADRYDPELAALCLQLSLSLFRRTLS